MCFDLIDLCFVLIEVICFVACGHQMGRNSDDFG